MKKKSALLLLFALLLTLLVSCATTSTGLDATEDECLWTLEYVCNQTQQETVLGLFQDLNTYKEDFVPQKYAHLLSMRTTIPGMDRLLRDWAHCIADLFISNYDDFSTFTTELSLELEYPSPVAMILESDSSIGQTFKALYFSVIEQAVHSKLENADLGSWDAVVVQYNAWVTTQSVLGNDEYEAIVETDIVSQVSSLIASLYFDKFMAKETLIRTTPDLNMDFVASRVLGLY